MVGAWWLNSGYPRYPLGTTAGDVTAGPTPPGVTAEMVNRYGCPATSPPITRSALPWAFDTMSSRNPVTACLCFPGPVTMYASTGWVRALVGACQDMPATCRPGQTWIRVGLPGRAIRAAVGVTAAEGTEGVLEPPALLAVTFTL